MPRAPIPFCQSLSPSPDDVDDEEEDESATLFPEASISGGAAAAAATATATVAFDSEFSLANPRSRSIFSAIVVTDESTRFTSGGMWEGKRKGEERARV